MIYKNPHLLFTPIDDKYISCVNPFIKNGVKVISKTQYDFLSLIENSISEKDISEKTWYDEKIIKKLIHIFKANDILNDSWKFNIKLEDNRYETLDLWVHTTDKCNLRCTYCNIKTKLTLKDIWDDVIDDLCISLIETAKNHKLKKVKLRLSWWEPIIVYKKWLNKLYDLDTDLKKIGCSLQIAFLTNGTLINEEYIQAIKDNRIWLSISLDWLNEYNKNRITINWKNSFEKVKNNIEESLKYGVTPNIMIVVSNENMEWLPSLTRYLISKNLPFRYSFVQWQTLNQEKLINIMQACYLILEQALEQWYQFTKLHRLCDLKFLNPWNRTCYAWANWWAIYIDWWVYFCQTEFWDKQQELWNIKDNKDILNLIKKWSKKVWTLSENCNTCLYNKVCTWGCPLERENWKDIHCEIYKALIPKVYRLMWKERLLEILKKND